LRSKSNPFYTNKKTRNSSLRIPVVGIKLSIFMQSKVSVRKCIDEDAQATLSDGSRKKLKHIQVGDKVKTLDSSGQLVDTDVVMIIDKGTENCINSTKAFKKKSKSINIIFKHPSSVSKPIQTRLYAFHQTI
jgi:hypothetical protein